MKIEEMVNKFNKFSIPLVGLLYSSEIDEEVVRVTYSLNKRVLVIQRKNNKQIYISFDEEVKIDSQGGIDFIDNSKSHSLVIMRSFL